MSWLKQWLEWGLLQKQRHTVSAAEERWFLQYFHSRGYLDALAKAIAWRCQQLPQPCTVRARSLWVDGLPQAVGATAAGSVKCELADLLYVIKVRENGGVKRECALLLQAKMAEVHAVLPSGGKTPVERRLLEDHDWQTPIQLYGAFKALTSNLIGSFQLKSSGTGFEAFARYLLIAKDGTSRWRDTEPPSVAGWPDKRAAPRLRGYDLVDLSLAAFLMANWDSKRPGHPLQSAQYPNAAWDDLVDTLYGRKAGVNMDGYGQQPYVNVSRAVSSDRPYFRWKRSVFAMLERMLARWFWIPRLHAVEAGKSGHSWPPDDSGEGEGERPLMPIIEITIDFDERG